MPDRLPRTCHQPFFKDPNSLRDHDNRTYLKVFFWGVVLWGVFLAVYQFWLNRCLWLDEAHLAINIVGRGFIGLLAPLDNHQAAPIGFLFAEKMMALVFGNSDWALRVVPLLSFLFSIPLFYFLSRKLACDGLVAQMATALFSISWILLRYSSEVKQYSLDVFVSLLILCLPFFLNMERRSALAAAAVIGCAAIWFSNVAVVTLFVVGVYWLYIETYSRGNSKIPLVIAAWLVSFAVYYVFFIHGHPTRDYMLRFWRKSFLPANPFSREFYVFGYEKLQEVYGYMFGLESIWLVPLAISLFGVYCLVAWKKFTALYFCLAPVGVQLALSLLRLYPFYNRMILFLMPEFIFLFSMGVYFLAGFLRKSPAVVSCAVMALPVIIMFIPLSNEIPVYNDHVRESLKYVEQHIQEDETIYYYYVTSGIADFYLRAGFVNLTNPVVNGQRHRNENHKYNPELASLTGKVWLVFSHVYISESGVNEESYMIGFLKKNGALVLDSQSYPGSSVYLVDTMKPKAIRLAVGNP